MMLDRKSGIGASDIGKVAGLSPYGTALDVWLEKTGRVEDRRKSAKMAWGIKLEGVILDHYAEVSGRMVHPNRLLDGSQHRFIWSEKPWVYCTPDGFESVVPDGLGRFNPVGGDPALLEVKTAGWRSADRWGEPETDQVPEEYLAQDTWSMMVTGLRTTVMPVLFDGHEFRTYRVDYDAEFAGALLEVGERFWTAHVLADVPPEPQTPEQRIALQRALHPSDINSILQSSPEHDALALRLRDLRAGLALLEAEELELKSRLVEAIGNAAGIEGHWGKILYRASKDRRHVDWPALAQRILQDVEPAKRDELLAAHTEMKPGNRPFTPRFK